MMLSSINKL